MCCATMVSGTIVRQLAADRVRCDGAERADRDRSGLRAVAVSRVLDRRFAVYDPDPAGAAVVVAGDADVRGVQPGGAAAHAAARGDPGADRTGDAVLRRAVPGGDSWRVPPELEQAAMVDGASRVGAFLRVVVPLARNVILVTAILIFLQSFGEYVYSRSLIDNDALQTATVGTARLSGHRYIGLERGDDLRGTLRDADPGGVRCCCSGGS